MVKKEIAFHPTDIALLAPAAVMLLPHDITNLFQYFFWFSGMMSLSFFCHDLPVSNPTRLFSGIGFLSNSCFISLMIPVKGGRILRPPSILLVVKDDIFI